MIRAACLLCVLVVTQALRNARFLVRGKSHLSAMPQSFSQMGNYPQEKDPKESFDEYWNRPGPWDEKELGSLMDANKAWTDRMTTLNPTYFSDHERGHAPKILWIGCSDARVPANEIIGEPPGNVFVHRNIANQVVNTDFNCMSVIQYAVDVLEVKHIIVCGHYDCGGVKAALTNMDHKAPLENWLRNIRDTYRLHKDELKPLKDPLERQRKLVELNVVEQCLNVFKTAVVQKRRVNTYQNSQKPDSKVKFSTPVIHAMVYNPTTGDLKKLPVDFKEYLSDLQEVYSLYSLPESTTLDRTVVVSETGDEQCVTEVLQDSLQEEEEK